jgi:hypothetical protein
MFTNRFFHVLITIALMITLALTVREAFATSSLRAEENSMATCASLPSRYSMHTEYVPEANMWIVRTENGPTGVDGGLSELLSNRRKAREARHFTGLALQNWEYGADCPSWC